MGLRIDIGSGFKNTEGILRVDRDPKVNPDYVIDLEKDRLPFDDNSVEEVIATNILEHIGDGFFHLMQEIYRVCEHDAKFRVFVPYFRHDSYYNDPTHKRPFTFNTFQLFSKKYCDLSLEINNSSSGMAYDYNVDFEIEEYGYYIDPYYRKEFDKRMQSSQSEIEKEDFKRWCHDTNNVINGLSFLLKVIK